jgi:hypothetical protein
MTNESIKREGKMKILIIAYSFPPYNSMGAVRVGKIAKYLNSFGHEVRVITAKNQPLRADLPIEVPINQIIQTNWINMNKLPEMLIGGKDKVATNGYEIRLKNKSNHLKKFLKSIVKTYKLFLNYPDNRIGWLPYAKKSGNDLIEKWKPDIIYTSSLPFTSALVGSYLSKKYNIPWIAEFRDLWFDNPYNNTPSWRKKIDQKLETNVLKNASGIITVTQGMKLKLQNKTHVPSEVVYNGFDVTDINNIEINNTKNDKLSIVYTGIIYEGKRDPSSLFRALTKLQEEDRKLVEVKFYGKYMNSVSTLVEQYELSDIVSINPSVPYNEALAIQANADILLLLSWNDKREEGVIPGKVFEYIGAKKPILSIGYELGEAAKIISESPLNFVSNDSNKILNYLYENIKIKKQNKSLIEANYNDDYSREYQIRKIESFLKMILTGRSD